MYQARVWVTVKILLTVIPDFYFVSAYGDWEKDLSITVRILVDTDRLW